MKTYLHKNKKTVRLLVLIAGAILVAAAAAMVYLFAGANRAGADNAAYEALLQGDMRKLSLYAGFMKDKDMIIEDSTLLMRATQEKNKKAAEILINAGADGDKQIGDSTAFLQALRTKQFELAEIFIAEGKVDVNTKLQDKPYLLWMMDENNREGCMFLLQQPKIDARINIQGKSPGVYLYTQSDLTAQTAKAFCDRLQTDEGLKEYLKDIYVLRFFGGAYGIVTNNDVVPYILVCGGEGGKKNVYYLFDAKKFARYIDSSLAYASKYVCYAIGYGQEEPVYVSGIAQAESMGVDKMKNLGESVKRYLDKNTLTLAGTDSGNIASVSTLLQLVDASAYAVDDCFALDDEVYEILIGNYVQISTDVSAEALKDVQVVEYMSEKEATEAEKAILFTLRLYPLWVSEEIDHIYLVKSGSMKQAGININGAFTNGSDLILTNSGTSTLMITTYVHEFAHFITKENNRAALEDITKEYSDYGYYLHYKGESFYGVACKDAQGRKKEFLSVYAELNDNEALRKDGFVRPYGAYSSWEDFAATAESMYSFIGASFFQTYAVQNGYEGIEKKFDYVKSVYNEYAAAKKITPFMTETYFERVVHYLHRFGYDVPMLR